MLSFVVRLAPTSLGHIIDGVKVKVRPQHEVRNPATGEVVGQMPLGTKSDIDAAVAAARRAFKRWGRVSDDVRKLACKQIADRLGEKTEGFARLLTLEQGKPLQGLGSRWELGGTGLGGSVWSSDTEAAKRLASRMECGIAWVNKHGAMQSNAPFGGIKQSDIGVEFGEEGLLQNTNVQTIIV